MQSKAKFHLPYSYTHMQKPMSSVAMPEESPYATLGDVEPVNLISFAYQIAAGMVNMLTYCMPSFKR